MNNIGIKVTKTTTATVIAGKPPNVLDSIVKVLEDGSIGGNVSSDTWDNCRIKSYRLVDNATMGHLGADFNLPDYEYLSDNNCKRV